jgi:hypothetical protein
MLTDAYLAALVENLAKGGNAEDALALIKKIDAPPLRESSARSLWKAMLPPHPSGEKRRQDQRLYQSQADRTAFLNNLLNDPFFKDDLAFWDNILLENNNHFWRYYLHRASITTTEDNAWSKEIWAVHNKISLAKPHLKAPKCGGMSFNEIDLGGCRIQWLVVQGYYQYAMNDSRNDDKEKERAYTARQILIERLMKNNQSFRDTLSRNGSFPYLATQENKCPL